MAFDYSASFGGINNALANIGKQNELAWQRNAQADVGKSLQLGDYSAAAQKAFGYGDATTGLGLLKLGQTQKQIDGQNAISSLFAGGGVPSQSIGALGRSAPSIGTPNEVENDFVNAVKGAGLMNPIGLGAVAAYGKAESGYNPGNVNRSWNDPSQSGQPGTAGGIMSWRADRLQNLQRFAASRGEQGNGSPKTQALFLAQEDPTLIPKLQAAKTPEEANQIMAQAWRFAGYNQPGGENARRLALTQGYAQRFGGQGGAAPAVPVQVAENEADVQRLEAQQGNPVVGTPAQGTPVQVAQADAPAPGAKEAQFSIPGSNLPPNDPYPRITTQQLYGIAMNPNASEGQRATAKSIIDARQKYSDENAPDKREMTRLQTQKLRQEVDASATPLSAEERQQFGIPDNVMAYRKSNGDLGFAPAGTNINMPAAEKEADKAYGKIEGEALGNIYKAGANASKRIEQLNIMEHAYKRGGGNISNGPMAQFVLRAKQGLGNAFGIDIAGTQESEVIQKIGFGLATESVRAISARPTQMEFAKALENNPGLLMTNKGSQFMISILKQQAQQERDLARLVRDPKNRSNWMDVEEKYYNDHPIISPFTNKPLGDGDMKTLQDDLAKEGGGAQSGANADQYRRPDGSALPLPSQGAPARITNPQDAMKLPSGTEFIDPNGVRRRVP